MGTIQNKHHSTESSKNAQNTETQGLFYKEPLMLHRGSSHMKKSVATTHPTSLTKILYKKKFKFTMSYLKNTLINTMSSLHILPWVLTNVSCPCAFLSISPPPSSLIHFICDFSPYFSTWDVLVSSPPWCFPPPAPAISSICIFFSLFSMGLAPSYHLRFRPDLT